MDVPLASVATYFPGRMAEHPKSKSTQTGSQTTIVTLYFTRTYLGSYQGIVFTREGAMKLRRSGKTLVSDLLFC